MPTTQPLLTALQQMWAEVNVTLNIEQLDAPTRTDRYRANDYQMRTSGWTNDINDPGQITAYFAASTAWSNRCTPASKMPIWRHSLTKASVGGCSHAADQCAQISSSPKLRHHLPLRNALSGRPARPQASSRPPLGQNIFTRVKVEK
ncbi:MAG: ABC transporter substrate-binding protein [Caldilineaceae bacterium]